MDDGDWLQTLANNTKIQIGGMGDEIAKRFHGSVSCVQVYNVGMNEAELITKKNCPDLPASSKSSSCPEGFNAYNNKCIKVTIILKTFY